MSDNILKYWLVTVGYYLPALFDEPDPHYEKIEPVMGSLVSYITQIQLQAVNNQDSKWYGKKGIHIVWNMEISRKEYIDYKTQMDKIK